MLGLVRVIVQGVDRRCAFQPSGCGRYDRALVPRRKGKPRRIRLVVPLLLIRAGRGLREVKAAHAAGVATLPHLHRATRSFLALEIEIRLEGGTLKASPLSFGRKRILSCANAP